MIFSSISLNSFLTFLQLTSYYSFFSRVIAHNSFFFLHGHSPTKQTLNSRLHVELLYMWHLRPM